MNQLTVIIERDAEGLIIASVPTLHGCHTQAPTITEALSRIAEAIELHGDIDTPSEVAAADAKSDAPT